jgi:hypothetical protein
MACFEFFFHIGIYVCYTLNSYFPFEVELDGPAVSVLSVRSRKLSNNPLDAFNIPFIFYCRNRRCIAPFIFKTKNCNAKLLD